MKQLQQMENYCRSVLRTPLPVVEMGEALPVYFYTVANERNILNAFERQHSSEANVTNNEDSILFSTGSFMDS